MYFSRRYISNIYGLCLKGSLIFCVAKRTREAESTVLIPQVPSMPGRARWLLSLSRMNNFSPVKCAESIEPLIFPIPGNFLGEISLIGRFPWFASGEIGGLWGKLYEVSLSSNSALRKPASITAGACLMRIFAMLLLYNSRADATLSPFRSLVS